VDGLVSTVEQSVDLDRLLEVASSRVASLVSPAAPARSRSPGASRARIGIARDLAFQFYYPANLDLLRAAGAELVPWSPLEDADLPEVDALYLGGGYPEVHARGLASNRAMLKAVKAFADSGRPVYAECGGLMYLARALEDEGGELHPMVGVLPATVRMTPKRLTLGYAEVELMRETPLGPSGVILRGHEFHASWIDLVPASVPRAYTVRMRRGELPREEGYLVGNALLSYVHLHFGSNPAVAEHLVRRCLGGRGR
jgi:cobyrinic acid a,c-diamide synthase